jgi:hypothetical protein
MWWRWKREKLPSAGELPLAQTVPTAADVW